MNCDVAIVGAGPAGSTAAIELARHGLRTILIEKGVPPRHKTCGGGILNRAVRLAPVSILPSVERECFAAELVHHCPSLRFQVRRNEPIVSMVMRDRFDHLLSEAARKQGAEMLTDATLLKVRQYSGHVALETTAGVVTSRFVIAADGVGSAVARATGAAELPKIIPALECELTHNEEILERFGGAARFDFGIVPHGYGWVFPKLEHLSIGVLTTRRGVANLNDYYQRYLKVLGLPNPIREERHGYMIPIQPRPNADRVPRVLFVGDAGGFVDPVLAEGITAAIRTGRDAANAIVRGNLDESAVKRFYRKSLKSSLLPELRTGRFLSRLLFDLPRVRASAFSRLGSSLCETVTDVVMGTTTYTAIVRRPFHYWRLISLCTTARGV